MSDILEHRDAGEAELGITEVNSGTYVFRAKELREALAKVGTKNSQGEKYLTDVVEYLTISGQTVSAVAAAEAWLVAGVNDRVQLAEVAARHREEILLELRQLPRAEHARGID